MPGGGRPETATSTTPADPPLARSVSTTAGVRTSVLPPRMLAGVRGQHAPGDAGYGRPGGGLHLAGPGVASDSWPLESTATRNRWPRGRITPMLLITHVPSGKAGSQPFSTAGRVPAMATALTTQPCPASTSRIEHSSYWRAEAEIREPAEVRSVSRSSCSCWRSCWSVPSTRPILARCHAGPAPRSRPPARVPPARHPTAPTRRRCRCPRSSWWPVPGPSCRGPTPARWFRSSRTARISALTMLAVSKDRCGCL